MNLRLLALRATGPSTCLADFELKSEDIELETVEFRIDNRTGIATASCTPDIFRNFDGTAEEQRRIVAAVIAFWRAGQQ